MKRDVIPGTDDLAVILAGMSFAKKRFGGVDETSVWEEIRRLNRAYRVCLSLQEERYRELISRYEEIIARQQKELSRASARSLGDTGENRR